jgi:hypothetical protein
MSRLSFEVDLPRCRFALCVTMNRIVIVGTDPLVGGDQAVCDLGSRRPLEYIGVTA